MRSGETHLIEPILPVTGDPRGNVPNATGPCDDLRHPIHSRCSVLLREKLAADSRLCKIIIERNDVDIHVGINDNPAGLVVIDFRDEEAVLGLFLGVL